MSTNASNSHTNDDTTQTTSSNKLDNLTRDDLIKLIKKYTLLHKQLKSKSDELSAKLVKYESDLVSLMASGGGGETDVSTVVLSSSSGVDNMSVSQLMSSSTTSISSDIESSSSPATSAIFESFKQKYLNLLRVESNKNNEIVQLNEIINEKEKLLNEKNADFELLSKKLIIHENDVKEAQKLIDEKSSEIEMLNQRLLDANKSLNCEIEVLKGKFNDVRSTSDSLIQQKSVQIDELNKQLEEKTIKIDELMLTLNNEIKENNERNQKIEDLESQLKQANLKIEEKVSEIESLTKKFQMLNDDNHQIEKLNGKVESLEDELHKANLSNEKILNEKNLEIEKLNGDLTDLRRQIDEFLNSKNEESNSNYKDIEIQSLRKSLEDVQNDLKEAKMINENVLNVKNEEINELKKRFEDLNNQLNDATENDFEFESVKKSVIDLQTKLSEDNFKHEIVLNEKNKEIECLNVKLTDVNAEIEELKVKNLEFERNLNNSEDVKQLKMTIEDLQSGLNEADFNKEELLNKKNEEIENLNKKISELNIEYATIETIKEKIKILEAIIGEKDSNIDNLRREIELNKSILEMLNNEIKLLNDEKIENEKIILSYQQQKQKASSPKRSNKNIIQATPEVIIEEDEESQEEAVSSTSSISLVNHHQHSPSHHQHHYRNRRHNFNNNNSDISENDMLDDDTKKHIEDMTFYIDELKAELEANKEEISTYKKQIEDFEDQYNNLIKEKDQIYLDLIHNFNLEFNLSTSPVNNGCDNSVETLLKQFKLNLNAKLIKFKVNLESLLKILEKKDSNFDELINENMNFNQFDSLFESIKSNLVDLMNVMDELNKNMSQINENSDDYSQLLVKCLTITHQTDNCNQLSNCINQLKSILITKHENLFNKLAQIIDDNNSNNECINVTKKLDEIFEKISNYKKENLLLTSKLNESNENINKIEGNIKKTIQILNDGHGDELNVNNDFDILNEQSMTEIFKEILLKHYKHIKTQNDDNERLNERLMLFKQSFIDYLKQLNDINGEGGESNDIDSNDERQLTIEFSKKLNQLIKNYNSRDYEDDFVNKLISILKSIELNDKYNPDESYFDKLNNKNDEKSLLLVKQFQLVMNKHLGLKETSIKSLEAKLKQQETRYFEEKEQFLQHIQTLQQDLDKLQKTSQKTNVMQLELADYDRTINNLNQQLQAKEKQIVETKQEITNLNAKIDKLNASVKTLEQEKQSSEEKQQKLKQFLVKAKKELSDAKQHETEHMSQEALYKAQIEKLNIEIENSKLQTSELLSDKQKLCDKYQLINQTNVKIINDLEKSKENLLNELNNLKENYNLLKTEYENYKVRVQHAFKKQKEANSQNDSSNNANSATSLSVVNTNDALNKENMDLRLTITKLHEKLVQTNELINQLEKDKEILQDDCQRALDRYTKLITETKVNELELKMKYDEIIEQNRLKYDEFEIQIKQFKQENENLKKLQKEQLNELKKEHCHVVDKLQIELDETKDQIKLLNRTPTLTPVKANNQDNIETMSNNSDSTSDILSLKKTSSKLPRLIIDNSKKLVNTFEELLDSKYDDESSTTSSTSTAALINTSNATATATNASNILNEQQEQFILNLKDEISKLKIKLEHLTELLNESELNNVRLSEQISLLKEEIRRLERNQEREKSIANMEYLKNVVYKYLTFNTSQERVQLLPVLSTILKLSQDEQANLLNSLKQGDGNTGVSGIASGGAASSASSASSWSSYWNKFTSS